MKVMNGLDLNGQRITNLGDPNNPQDSATKNYVDNISKGLDWRPHVRAASPSDVSVSSGPATIDGVTFSAGDRVLLIAQTNAAENGPWVYGGSGAAMSRPSDFTGTLPAGTAYTVLVTEGSTYADQAFTLSTDAQIVVGTTSTNWVQIGGGNSYGAGAGLTLTGSTFNVVAADGSIVVNADSITVGTVPISKGGTGATSAAGARSALGAVGKYAATISTTAGAAFTVNHNLGTTDVTTALYDSATGGNQVIADVAVVDGNNLTVTTATATTSYRIVVTG